MGDPRRFKIKVAYFGSQPVRRGGPPRDPRPPAIRYLRYISHREEQLPQGETRTLYGIGVQYRALKGDEEAIVRRLRADAEGVRSPRYYRGILTVSDEAAERLARLRPLDAERVMRDAVDRVFRSVLRGAQGAYAIHTHGGPGRPHGHPHAHFLLSPIESTGKRVSMNRALLSRFRSQWADIFEKELRRALVRHQVEPARTPTPQAPTHEPVSREPAPRGPIPPRRDSAAADLRATVTRALEGRPTLTEFAQRLERAGVNLKAQIEPDGSVRSIGYRVGRSYVRARDLGPGQRWERLRKHLAPDPDGDAVVLPTVGRLLKKIEPAGAPALGGTVAPEAFRQRVADVLDRLLDARPTFTDFVRKVENEGIEVRLYRSSDDRILSIGYGVDGQSVPARHLPPGHSWSRLQSRLDFDPERDAAAVELVAEPVRLALAPPRSASERPYPTPAQVEYVRGAIDHALHREGVSLTEFARQVEANGVEVRILMDHAKRPVALDYAVGNVRVTRAQLGDAHGVHGLKARGLVIDLAHDRAVLRSHGRVLPRRALHEIANAFRQMRSARSALAHPGRQLATRGLAAVVREARKVGARPMATGAANAVASRPGLAPLRLIGRTALAARAKTVDRVRPGLPKTARAVSRAALNLWIRAMPPKLRAAVQIARTVRRIFGPSDEY